jgi:hypothetical protein
MLIRVTYISMSLYIWIRRIQDLLSLLLLEQMMHTLREFLLKSSIMVNKSILVVIVYLDHPAQIMCG